MLIRRSGDSEAGRKERNSMPTSAIGQARDKMELGKPGGSLPAPPPLERDTYFTTDHLGGFSCQNLAPINALKLCGIKDSFSQTNITDSNLPL